MARAHYVAVETGGRGEPRGVGDALVLSRAADRDSRGRARNRTCLGNLTPRRAWSPFGTFEWVEWVEWVEWLARFLVHVRREGVKARGQRLIFWPTDCPG
jgi:hypothetical protein